MARKRVGELCMSFCLNANCWFTCTNELKTYLMSIYNLKTRGYQNRVFFF